jgi:hypothetical protein
VRCNRPLYHLSVFTSPRVAAGRAGQAKRGRDIAAKKGECKSEKMASPSFFSPRLDRFLSLAIPVRPGYAVLALTKLAKSGRRQPIGR